MNYVEQFYNMVPAIQYMRQTTATTNKKEKFFWFLQTEKGIIMMVNIPEKRA